MLERKFRPHPDSAPGEFYVVNGECLSCGAPHAVAPDLIGWADPNKDQCIWKKQPETEAEMEQAFAAFDASCVGCYRYAGCDPVVMERIGFDYCDHAPPSWERNAQVASARIAPLTSYERPGWTWAKGLRVIVWVGVAAFFLWLVFVRVAPDPRLQPLR